ERTIAAHRVEPAAHLRARLPGLDASIPCLGAAVERAELRRNLSRAFRTQLMTRGAAARLQPLDPVALALDVRVDAAAAARVARELALLGHFDQREPVAGGIVLGRGARVRRDD